MTLLQKLKQLQSDEDLSDEAFARKLGVTRTYWFWIRTGQTAITIKVLRGVARTYPHLQKDIIAYLAAPEPQRAASAA